jgi:hypothetical protein
MIQLPRACVYEHSRTVTPDTKDSGALRVDTAMSDNDDELQRLFENYELVETRRAGPTIDRDAWIAVSRRIFSPGDREACYVCGRFKSIAQAHHVIPLTVQYDRGFKYPDQEYVWLCPNHHTMAHLFIPTGERSRAVPTIRTRFETTSALNEDLTEEEFNRMMKLVRRSMRSPE